MNKDQVKGREEEIVGKTKKVVGGVVHDQSLKNKGRVEEAAGKARATYGDAKNQVKKDLDEDDDEKSSDRSSSKGW